MMAANATSSSAAASSATATVSPPAGVVSPPLTTGANASSTPSSASAYASFSASSALANTKSHSMVSVSSDGSNGSGNQSQAAMMAAAAAAAAADTALTAEVRSFKDALSRLRRTLTETEGFKATKVSSHERLAEMLKILRSMFDRYPSLKCPDLVHSVEVLMDLVKSLKDYDSFEEVEWPKMVHAVDAVAMSFSARVSDCVAGELSVSGGTPGSHSGKEKDLFLGLDLTPSDHHHHHQYYHYLAPMSVDEVDSILMRHPKGVDKALNYAKVWDKYTKYVTDYVKKRASLELELSRGLSLLAQQTRPFLQAESHLPYQSLYCTALDQDQEMCTKTLATCSVLQGGRFMEPLMGKRQEQTKQRKLLKERWRGELKQLQKSVGNLKKVRSVYMESKKEHGRYQEAVRIAQQGAEIGATGENKVEKRKKLEEEAMQKSREHEEVINIGFFCG